jgi:hypothetical protein
MYNKNNIDLAKELFCAFHDEENLKKPELFPRNV